MGLRASGPRSARHVLDHDEPAVRRRRRLRGARLPDVPPGRDLRRHGLQLQVTAIDILNPIKPVHPAVSQRMRCSETSSQDCSAAPCPPGETCRTFGGPIPGWEVFLEANGNWQKLAGLDGIMAPGSVPQSLRYDEAVPATGGVLRLHATGHSSTAASRSTACRSVATWRS